MTTPKNSSKPPRRYAPPEKASSLPTNLQDQSIENLIPSNFPTMNRTEEDTEICFSPPQESRTTSLESSSTNKPPSKLPMKESTSPNTSKRRELSPESKLIRDSQPLQTEKDKTTPKESINCQLWRLNFTNLDADSPSGEPS